MNLSSVLRENNATEEQIAVIRGWSSLFFGFFGAFVFSQLAAALLLGYWLNSLDGEEGSFGREFRALKLGRVLGIPATLLMASYLVLDVALVQNLVSSGATRVLVSGVGSHPLVGEREALASGRSRSRVRFVGNATNGARHTSDGFSRIGGQLVRSAGAAWCGCVTGVMRHGNHTVRKN